MVKMGLVKLFGYNTVFNVDGEDIIVYCYQDDGSLLEVRLDKESHKKLADAENQIQELLNQQVELTGEILSKQIIKEVTVPTYKVSQWAKAEITEKDKQATLSSAAIRL